MKTQILAFIFAATAFADRDHIFYVKVDGKYVTLTDSNFLDRDSPAPKNNTVSSVPVFTLEGDIAHIGYGKHKKYFGYENGVMVLGSRDKVEPFELSLDSYWKVWNINRKCKPYTPNECSEVEMYFVSPQKIFLDQEDPVSISEK